jgi:NAD(P)-dependent dehydrogenase (short-subunit alcohol dehydrogenase family)
LSQTTKIALVTGSARRLGASLALDLAARGWDMWIHYHSSPAEAILLAESIRKTGRRAWTVGADFSQEGGAEALVAALSPAPPNLIIHNASVWEEDTALTANSTSWTKSHRLHGWTCIVLARFLAQNGEGHLINLLDSRLRDRDPSHFSYAFAKRELLQLTRYLAAELAPRVRVNGLAPGMILKADHMESAAWQKIASEVTPLRRTGTTDELLMALHYLIGNTFVTGQILTIDGGRHLLGDLFGSI